MNDFLLDGVKTLVWTAMSVCASFLLFRFWVFHQLQREAKQIVSWCAVMLFTVETRINEFDTQVRKALVEENILSGLSKKPMIRELLQKMGADIAAFQTAAGALTSTLDLPFAFPAHQMRIAGFSASSSRWVSELQRTVTVLDNACERGMTDRDLRYVTFLLGGPSPVIGGPHAIDKAGAGESGLRTLLDECLRDLNSLSRSFGRKKHADYDGSAVWDNWEQNKWKPAKLPAILDHPLRND